MDIVKESLTFCNRKFRANILAYVIMPNHLHIILEMENSNERINYMRDFKKYSSTMIRKEIELHSPEILDIIRYNYRKQCFKIWTDRFDEVYVESKKVCEVIIDYIHDNPLQEKWQLVSEPAQYGFSSAAFYDWSAKDNLVENYHQFF